MAGRTYKSKLYILGQAFLVYMERWQSFLQAHMTPSEYTALTSCISCVSALNTLLKPDVIESEP